MTEAVDEKIWPKFEELKELPTMPQQKPNLLVRLLKQFPDKSWDWAELSCNPNIAVSWIKENLNLPWAWPSVCANPTLTMTTLNEFLLPKLEELDAATLPRLKQNFLWIYKYNRRWGELSANLGLKIEEILEHNDRKKY